MYEFTSEELFAFFGAFLILLWGISTILFSQISVKHIEREMAKEGMLPPLWDKGIGMRLPAYAGIIIFPNINRHASIVDIDATKRYARKIDLYLAIFMNCSFIGLAICTLVSSFLYTS